jgi:hypothetical protein
MADDQLPISATIPKKRKHTPAELINLGKRPVTSHGHWNDNIVAQYVLDKGSGEKWITVGELAHVAWHQNTPTNQAKARRYISRLWAYLFLNYGKFLVVEYGPPRNRARQLKIYNPNSQVEYQALSSKLDRMLHSKEMSTDRYNKAVELLNSLQSRET